jgi:hypothetical protein
MSTGDIISIVAVAMSFASIVASVFIYLNQKKYIATQDNLNKLLLQKERAELESAKEGDVGATVVRLGSNQYRIRVFNKSRGRAYDVRISYPEDHDWGINDHVFPLEFLDSGQSVDVILVLSFGCKSKIRAVLSWSDGNGSHRNEVMLTR